MNQNGGKNPEPFSHALAAAEHSATRARRRYIRLQAQAYSRKHHLPRLIRLPRQVGSLTEPDRTLAIIARLKQALRAGLALRSRREWSWCRRRHTALLAALGGELRRLRAASKK